MQQWQTNWQSFIEFLNDELRAGRRVEDIAEQLSGQSVEWIGTLSEKRFNAIAWRAKVLLPPRELVLAGECATKPIRSISIPVHADDVSKWNDYEEGSVIRFGARLVTASDTPFRALTVNQFDDGSSFVILRVATGHPICKVSNHGTGT